MNAKKLLLSGGMILAAVLAVAYMWFFLQKGVVLGDTFFLRTQQQEGAIFAAGESNIAVAGSLGSQGSAAITYAPAGQRVKRYDVTATPTPNGLENLVITQDGQPYFTGSMLYNAPHLYNMSGEPDLGEIEISFSDSNATQPAYPAALSPYIVVRLATGEGLENRGNGALLLLAVLMLVITVLDYCFPMLFFSLNHRLSVRDPEPSDFYVTMQHIGWVALPLFAAGLLVAALFVG